MNMKGEESGPNSFSLTLASMGIESMKMYLDSWSISNRFGRQVKFFKIKVSISLTTTDIYAEGKPQSSVLYLHKRSSYLFCFLFRQAAWMGPEGLLLSLRSKKGNTKLRVCGCSLGDCVEMQKPTRE